MTLQRFVSTVRRRVARRPAARTRSTFFVGWLICALVGAQALGLHHAIVHADRIESLATLRVAAPLQPDSTRVSTKWSASVEHSCAAFDGVTLAASAPSLPPLLPVHGATQVIAVVAPRVAPQTPLVLGYRSRAPPASLSA